MNSLVLLIVSIGRTNFSICSRFGSKNGGKDNFSPSVSYGSSPINPGVAINSDMSFSHTIKLNTGENKLSIHIEPSETSKSTIFKNDGGAIAKATKTIDFIINKN
jgi:hypothetical protein